MGVRTEHWYTFALWLPVLLESTRYAQEADKLGPRLSMTAVS